MRAFTQLASWLASTGAALMAGFFFSWQWVVLPGLEAAGPDLAIEAMNGVNRVIRTPTFALAFFGTFVAGFLACLLAVSRTTERPSAALLLAGVVIYGAGVLLVTFTFNVPLNEGLARLAPAANPARVWSAYSAPWASWNLVRFAASLAGFAAFAAAAVRLHRHGS